MQRGGLRENDMNDVTQLNQRFGIADELEFRGDAGGLVIAEINNDRATASLCLQGAHLMTWHPRSQAQPVLWLSRDARLVPGKSIRGGVPVCWPWFGEHASEPDFPAHGFARTSPWQVIESGNGPDGATQLSLRLVESERTRACWNHPCRLELSVSIGETLRMELVTENTGEEDFVIGEALHSYFRISDIAAVNVSGLTACDYWDKVGGTTFRRQDGTIGFSAETDRVYIDTSAECVIEDSQLQRRIHIVKSGSRSTVVWNPWTDKARRMGDLGQPDGWREMVCVESGNVYENVVTLAAGGRHMLMVEYRIEQL